MAGDGHSTIHMDPALVKYNNMAVDRYKFFRWTPRTSWITFAYVVVVPSIVGYIAYTTDGKYTMRGKLRGDIIADR